MAGELRDFFNGGVVRDIARDLKRADPAFPERRFVTAALDGLAPLSLTGRAAHIAQAMRRFLPKDFADAAAVLSRSLGPRHAGSDSFGMAPFKYLPHTMFVAAHGLAHFEESMRLQVELTQRFSAEFSIRAFLTHHTEATHARLVEWARHDDYVVHYVKANGRISAKVFKLKRVTLASKQAVPIGIRIKLADLTTRKHHAGRHSIDLLVNGVRYPLGAFRLTCP